MSKIISRKLLLNCVSASMFSHLFKAEDSKIVTDISRSVQLRVVPRDAIALLCSLSQDAFKDAGTLCIHTEYLDIIIF